MKLIIGLGNPGKQYETSRHNAGFIILDEIQKKLNFPTFENVSKFDCEISELSINGEKNILAKPQSFMNKSGEVAKKIMDFYKIPKEDITVIHDDLDIELGKYKVSTDSSAAGHNGIQNIIDNIGSQQFKRVRIGIEGAEMKKQRVIPGSVFVLQNFSPEEIDIIKNLSNKIKSEIF